MKKRIIRLGVCIDNIAAVRNAEKGKEPDPVAAAVLAETAGVDGIVCHLREDRRYIKERDLFLLKEVIKSHFNIRIAPAEDMVKTVMKVSPDMVTLVPEIKDGNYPKAGINVELYTDRISKITDRFHSNGIIVSYYIDPDIGQLKASAKAGADCIEINTNFYAHAKDSDEEEAELQNITSIAQGAFKLGLGVSAGGGLNYHNISDVAQISEIEELNVGHSVISKTVMIGIDGAVRDMIYLIR